MQPRPDPDCRVLQGLNQTIALARRLQPLAHRVTPSFDSSAAGSSHHDPLVMPEPAASIFEILWRATPALRAFARPFRSTLASSLGREFCLKGVITGCNGLARVPRCESSRDLFSLR